MNEMLAGVSSNLAIVLIRFVWQGVVIGLLAALALGLLRNARPQLRYAVGCAALLCCVLVPTWQFLALMLDPVPETGLPTISRAAVADMAVLLPAPFASSSIVPETSADTLRWVTLCWALGAGLLSLRMIGGLWWVRGLRASADSTNATPWTGLQAVVDRLAAGMGLRRTVFFRIIEQGNSPLSAEWLRPVILLPAALALRLPAPLIEALLAHELAHIRRNDYLINLIQSAIEVVLFYHPVAWWLSRQIREEREQIADQIAAVALGDPRRMAAALAEIDTDIVHGAALAQSAHGGHLMTRIQKLVRPTHRSVIGAVTLPAFGLGLAGFALYAHASIFLGESSGTNPGGAELAAVAAPKIQVSLLQAGEDSFGLVRKDHGGIVMSGQLSDADTIRSLREVVPGNFIWYRRSGQDRVIRDPKVLARAAEIWRPADELDRQMRALDARMQPHQRKVEAIGKRMAQMETDSSHAEGLPLASDALATLTEKQRELTEARLKLELASMQAGPGDQDRVQADLARLEEDQQQLNGLIERQSRQIETQADRIREQSAPMEGLDREMRVATAPMESIGREMEVLGREIEKTAAAAKVEMRKLIDQSEQQGLAEAVPAAR